MIVRTVKRNVIPTENLMLRKLLQNISSWWLQFYGGKNGQKIPVPLDKTNKLPALQTGVAIIKLRNSNTTEFRPFISNLSWDAFCNLVSISERSGCKNKENG